MALRMPRPVTSPTGVYQLNIRVPSDLTAKVKGTVVTLPIGDVQVDIRPSDKVIVSLRTRDPRLAKERFAEAERALSSHWDALRRGPRPLTHKQVVALAGDCYRSDVAACEADHAFMPDGFLAAQHAFETDVTSWRNDPTDGFGDIGERDGRLLASLARPFGPQWLAFERGCDIDELGVRVSYETAIEDLFGAQANQVLRERHLIVDVATRRRLVKEIAVAYRLLDHKLHRNASGDYSPDDNAARFPVFEPPQPVNPPDPSRDKPISVATLFRQWRERRGPSLAASTVRRYAPSIASLERHSEGKDVRALTDEDVWKWAEHRLTEGAAARTVNRNEVVAVASILEWATTRDGGRLRSDNPAKGVKLPEPKRRVLREKTFRSAEVSAILKLARSVTIDKLYPKASAGRRWGPWICAYSGARIQEVLHLTRESIWCEAGVWVMRFPETKDGFARTVPLHEHLIAEGLLDVWRAAKPGHLFMFDRAAKEGASRSAQEMRASEIAEWIQKHIALDNGVSPNHGWRHTFATNAESAGIPKRISTAITGHNKRKDASDGYIAPSVQQLKQAIDRFPRFQIEKL